MSAPGEPAEVMARWVSVAPLQCRLRELFAARPVHRALAAALQQIGELLGASYAVIHARYGFVPLSEEWQAAGHCLDDALRERLAETMVAAASGDAARCVRLQVDGGTVAVVASLLYDRGAEQVGGAAFVFADCDRAHAHELLAQVESLIGFLALLLADTARQPVPRGMPSATGAGGEPLRVLLQLDAEIAGAALDQVAIGVVSGHRVDVVLIDGELAPRRGSPVVRRIAAAMAECVDRGAAIAVVDAAPGAGAGARLHQAWRQARGGGAVASAPMRVGERIVGVIAFACADAEAMSPAVQQRLAAIATGHAPLLPLVTRASRTLRQHLAATVVAWWQHQLSGPVRWARAALVLAAMIWIAFGTLPYAVTVPGVVEPAEPRVIACPRDGVLADVFVAPGDQVVAGQPLAQLDAHEDSLVQAELLAEARGLQARVDRALADRDAGQLRVLEAQRQGVLARAATVAQRIELALVRAPRDGVVLAGELRQRIGARLAMGDTLFEVARADRAVVRLRVPERHAGELAPASTATFVPIASPTTAFALRGLRLAPTTVPGDSENVFELRAEGDELARLSPGSAGHALVEVGARPVWWVLSHRLLDWLRLNFWI
ncbi:MAG: efflux RND transporter periplasmic adaptor subunit [Planctomycetes bacterium]|nr:efflux RND transporter periplasmic adaptor subunit [Planctomycetota bacterium]